MPYALISVRAYHKDIPMSDLISNASGLLVGLLIAGIGYLRAVPLESPPGQCAKPAD
jgi:hypothetical protein